MPGFQLQNISKTVKVPAGAPLPLLQGVDLDLPADSIHALIGPSGGGKTTLLRLLNRLDLPDAGDIRFNDLDLAAIDPLQLRQKIALVPQKPYMFPGSALDNLQVPFRWLKRPLPQADVELTLSCIDICQFDRALLPRDARQLSIGQQQRLAVARALMLEPEALLLDEPTSALDRPTADRFARQLQEIRKRLGLTVVMVSHDLDLVRRIADRVVFLDRGRVLETGTVEAILDMPSHPVIRAFRQEPEENG